MEKYALDNFNEVFDRLYRKMRMTNSENPWKLYPIYPILDDEIFLDNCLHDQCPECFGSGIKINGDACFHNISCGCSKCSPN